MAKNAEKVDLDEIMQIGAVESDPHRSLFTRFLMFVGGVGAVALFVGVLMVPIGFATSAAGHAGVDYWDSMETELLKDEIRLPQKTTLLDRDGKEFASYYSENRESITFDKMPKDFLEAIVATEDSRFWENNGYDGVGLIRSAISTGSGAEVQGASGITQQLVKNILILNAESEEEMAEVQDRTIPTKIQELKYSVHMNDKYSKEEILEMYANTIFFGERSYGIKAAAWAYFSKEPQDLTLSESAMLAGVINNPTVFSPIDYPERAHSRKNTVLWRMLDEGYIDQKTYDAETEVEVAINPGTSRNGCGVSEYAYYCSLVQKEILRDSAFGKDRAARENFLYRGGLTITTALDRDAMDVSMDTVERAWGNDNEFASGTATVVPGTGELVSIAQNRDWDDTQVIYADAERQTGSAFKPFTISTAYEQGVDAGNTVYNSDSYYKPQGYDSPDQGFINFGAYDYGSVNGFNATRLSLNTWFIRLTQAVGAVEVANHSNRLGLSLPTDPNAESNENYVNRRSLSIALGAWGASPIEMANAYSVWASGGVLCKPHTILSAKWSDTGEEVPTTDPKCHQAIMPNIGHQMNRILQQPLAEGGTMVDYNLAGGRQSAGKTGTSNNKGDAWVVGYTPQYSTAVWSGDPKGATNGMWSYTQFGRWQGGMQAGTGGPTSGPIYEPIMNSLHEGLPAKRFPAPSNDVGSAIRASAVPSVVGMDVDHAVTTLQDYGFEVVINDETAGDDKMAANTVASQDPMGGSTSSYGMEVRLTLSPGSDTSVEIRNPEVSRAEAEKNNEQTEENEGN